MGSFKMYECDFGVKINGVSYDFTDVAEVQVEDPLRNRLVRGSNGKNTTGLTYRDGVRDPKRWTIPILNMSIDLKAVLDSAFENATRLDVYCISRKDGSSKMLKSAVLCNQPQQLTIDETPESMNVSLEFEGFQSDEVHKS